MNRCDFKPSGYWLIKENRELAAIGCTSKKDYADKFSRASAISKKEKELDDFAIKYKWDIIRIPNNYWNDYERCKLESLKYKTRTKFQQGSKTAYKFSSLNNWIDEFIPSLSERLHDLNWNVCLEIMKTELTKSSFVRKHNRYYQAIKENGLEYKLNEYFDVKPNIDWTKEKCFEVGLKCKSRSEFRELYETAYSKAYLNGWVDEISKNYPIVGGKYKRCVYVFEFFNSNTCYVGLTGNLENRKYNHINRKCPVGNYILNVDPKYIVKQLTSYVDVKEAQRIECEYIEKYKNEGWHLINTAKGGGIGGNNQIYTKEYCYGLAVLYFNRSEFRKLHLGAYTASLKNKWLDEICSHMEKIIVISYDDCKNCASSCLTLGEFKKKFPSEYSKSIRNNWLSDFKLKICAAEHFYWNDYDRCLEASKTCLGRQDFCDKFYGAHKYSKINGWLDEFFPKKRIYKGRIKKLENGK